jgi:hypothetical protein
MRDVRDELIRIDAQGVAHPIGTVASQRMRPHQGTYRLLPGPEHVVFMRFVGDDGQVDEGDGAIVRLAGEIAAPGTICDILALLAQTGWRGILCVHEDTTTRRLFIDRGNVIGAQTNAKRERLGQVMYRYGMLTEEELGRVEVGVGPGRRFGEVAIELGVVQKEQIYNAIRRQIEEVTFGAMAASDGTFFFLDGMDEAQLPVRQVVSLNALLMDGVTRLDEGKYFQQKIPSKDYVPERVEGTDPGPDYAALWSRLDGRRSVEELGRITGLGEFETTKKLYALVQAKHVVIHPPRQSGGLEGIVAAANDVLSAAFRAAEETGQAEELRRSLEAFTVGAGVLYDLLFRGAGPDAQGRLGAERVAQNAPLVSRGTDPEQTVRQLLFDYASFALFSVGSAVGQEREAHLVRSAADGLRRLRGPG